MPTDTSPSPEKQKFELLRSADGPIASSAYVQLEEGNGNGWNIYRINPPAPPPPPSMPCPTAGSGLPSLSVADGETHTLTITSAGLDYSTVSRAEQRSPSNCTGSYTADFASERAFESSGDRHPCNNRRRGGRGGRISRSRAVPTTRGGGGNTATGQYRSSPSSLEHPRDVTRRERSPPLPDNMADITDASASRTVGAGWRVRSPTLSGSTEHTHVGNSSSLPKTSSPRHALEGTGIVKHRASVFGAREGSPPTSVPYDGRARAAIWELADNKPAVAEPQRAADSRRLCSPPILAPPTDIYRVQYRDLETAEVEVALSERDDKSARSQDESAGPGCKEHVYLAHVQPSLDVGGCSPALALRSERRAITSASEPSSAPASHRDTGTPPLSHRDEARVLQLGGARAAGPAAAPRAVPLPLLEVSMTQPSGTARSVGSSSAFESPGSLMSFASSANRRNSHEDVLRRASCPQTQGMATSFRSMGQSASRPQSFRPLDSLREYGAHSYDA